jgi:hypothetical protein
VLGDKTFLQRLDYDGVPFKCHRCHQHGHVISQCHLPLKVRHEGSGSQSVRKIVASLNGEASRGSTNVRDREVKRSLEYRGSIVGGFVERKSHKPSPIYA